MVPGKLILLFMNPITLWLRWLVKKFVLEYKNRKNHLLLDYMTDVKDCQFGKFVTIYKYTRLLSCNIGSYTYISKDGQIQYSDVGNFCSIGPGVKVGLGKHPARTFVSSHPIFFSNKRQSQVKLVDKSIFEEYARTSIGNDVWIGANTTIMDGVTIGDGAIIGSRSVVTKDVAPFAIVGGVPAKLIRYRFSEDEINFLMKFQWWNKDLNWLKEHAHLFRNIESFKQHFAG